MQYLKFIVGLCAIILILGCEELIEVDLNASDPKVVIVADLNNQGGTQEIMVSRTVNFDEDRSYDPVKDALVYLRSQNGRIYDFDQQQDGRYTRSSLPLEVGESYSLEVIVDEQQYSAQSVMTQYVEIDSLGLTKENIFNDTYYFVNLKFQDPKGEENYYRYTVSLNGAPFVFSSVFSDKFNDGNQVTHQVGPPGDTELKPGDELRIRRSTVSKNIYQYWSEFQMTNPGSAAPGNPTSNINNGALGYFSVSNVREYNVTVEDELE